MCVKKKLINTYRETQMHFALMIRHVHGLSETPPPFLAGKEMRRDRQRDMGERRVADRDIAPGGWEGGKDRVRQAQSCGGFGFEVEKM